MFDDDPLLLRRAKRFETIVEDEAPLPELSTLQYIREWLNGRANIVFVIQTISILMALVAGVFMIFNSFFGQALAESNKPTLTLTPLPTIITRTPIPTTTASVTPIPTNEPQGKGKSMADIFTSGYEGYDNRFGSRLMGTDPDFDEYLLCFDGTGIRRTLNGVIEDGVWATWEEQDGFCIPGIFYSYSSASDILITSDVVHSIGLSEAEWQQISVHIYEYGGSSGFNIFCPAGFVAQTSKFCLGS